MTEPLMIRRDRDRLLVKPRKDGFDLVASGGGNVTAAELREIEAYVAGKPGAEAFVAKVRKRMDR